MKRLAKSAWRPEHLSPSDWAEKHLILSHRFTSYPGRFRLAWAPYAREIIDNMADPDVDEVTVMSAAQIAKTTILMVGIAYVIDQRPGPTLFVLPNGDLCKSLSESRLQPIIQDCERLAAHMVPNKKKFRLQEMYLDRMQLALVGANSPANLASRPVVYLFLDEIDKYPKASEREASAVSLAEKRLQAQPNTKLWKTSTPTNTAGEIWQSFLNGDQRLYFVPCPHCGHKQILTFNGDNLLTQRYKLDHCGKVKWPATCKHGDDWNLVEVFEQAYFECGKCQGEIRDQHKASMVEAGEWVAMAPDRSVKHRSYHLGSIYALWPKCSFGSLTVQFLKSKAAGLAGLQDFANSVDGLPWIIESREAEVEEIAQHKQQYERGEIPTEGAKLICTVDVQENCFWFVVRAWRPGGSSWLVDWGRLEKWTELDDLLFNAEYETHEGEAQSIHRAWIDSGYRTDEVYEYCRQRRKLVIPCKGGSQYGQATMVSLGKTLNGGQQLRIIDKGIACDKFYDHRLSIPRETNGYWAIPENVDANYLKSITSWKRVKETNKWDEEKYHWQSKSKTFEHLADCEIMQEAVAHEMQLTFRKSNSQRRQRPPIATGRTRLPG